MLRNFSKKKFLNSLCKKVAFSLYLMFKVIAILNFIKNQKNQLLNSRFFYVLKQFNNKLSIEKYTSFSYLW